MYTPARRPRLPAVAFRRGLGPILAAAIMAVLLAACAGNSKTREQLGQAATAVPSAIASPTASPDVIRIAPLTGEIIDEAHFLKIEGRPPLAVMVDNIVTAAPQAGLDQADVVIEALVEGGITRFMAVFHSREPEVIEPVRSARTPFLYWVAEYNAVFVHVGSAELDGPADAGQQIRDWGIADIDLGMRRFDDSYIRDPGRRAPHNVLISASRIWEKARELGFEGSPRAVALWPFAGTEGLKHGVEAPGFTVRFGALSPRFTARWDWDPGTYRYLRSQFGGPQIDAVSGNRLAFANVIVQYADAYLADSSEHVLIDVVGEGRAQVFTGGQLSEATWRKADRNGRTEFFDLEGNPVPLLAGPTWIEVVQPSGGAYLD